MAMTPDIFSLVKNTASITTGGVTRFYPFHSAPQNPTAPYCTWQTIDGSPDEYLTCVPSDDTWTFQVDCFNKTATSVRNIASDVRGKLQSKWLCDFMVEMGRDPDTNLYRYTLRFSGRQAR